MIFPDKYEDINYSVIMLGYRIIKLLKKKDYHIHDLYKKIRKEYNIDILYYYDVLTFLWLLNSIEINFNIIRYSHDLKKDLDRT